MMWNEGWMAAAAIAVFGLAGCVKGVVGLGLPTVSMALLAVFMPPAQAAALLLLPSLVTNLVQMRPVAGLRPLLQRLGWMQLGIVLGTLGGVALWGGVGSLPAARPALGLALVMYALWGLSGLRWQTPAPHQAWLGAACGLLTGAITAVTGVFVVPAVAFLQSLGLSRPALMQAMGLCFTTSTLALGPVCSGRARAWGAGAGDGTGTAGFGPDADSGSGRHALGRVAARKLSPELFRKLLMLSLLALGVYLCF
jgi:uncharacterized membrane protein YfcA